jgi:hypothetical protein
MTTQIPFFKPCHCGGSELLTTLSGSHTLGHAHSRMINQGAFYTNVFHPSIGFTT